MDLYDSNILADMVEWLGILEWIDMGGIYETFKKV